MWKMSISLHLVWSIIFSWLNEGGLQNSFPKRAIQNFILTLDKASLSIHMKCLHFFKHKTIEEGGNILPPSPFHGKEGEGMKGRGKEKEEHN